MTPPSPARLPRLAVVATHPIQHFCPQYASWAALPDLEVCVFFGSSAGLQAYEDKNFGRTVQWDGLDVTAFPHVFLAGSDTRPISPGLDAPDLDAQLESYDPDVVMVYGYGYALSRHARAWAIRNGKKILYISDAEARNGPSVLTRAYKRLKLPRIFQALDVFATVGDANEEFYRSHGVPVQRFVRMPFSIDVHKYAPARENRALLRSETRARLGIADDEVMVSMVGKLISWKRQADLVRMLDHLGDLTQRVVVVPIGSGPDEEAIRALAAQQRRHRVHVTGFLQPSELPGCYAATDIYAHVAEHEPHSLAISEAIYMGCPVVISDRCGSYGPTDDVQVGRNGFVYPCGDTRALAGHVARLAADPDLRAQMGAASMAHATHAQRLAHQDGIRAVLHVAGF